MNSAEVRDRAHSVYSNAVKGVTGGPEAAAGVLLAYKVSQLVANEIVSLLESRSNDSDIPQIIEGIRSWSGK